MSKKEQNVRFGQRMAEVRVSRMLSQAEVAGMLGRVQSWLGNIEAGRRGVSAISFIRWARLMGLTDAEWSRFRVFN